MVGTCAPFLLHISFTDFPSSNLGNHTLKKVHPKYLEFYSINPQAPPHFTNTIHLHPPQSKVLHGITNWINFPFTKDIGKQVGNCYSFLKTEMPAPMANFIF
jgi:hypothetical protein